MNVREGREQELVRAFFKGARSGFFVEVGANRPRQESQTWHLEQLGWSEKRLITGTRPGRKTAAFERRTPFPLLSKNPETPSPLA